MSNKENGGAHCLKYPNRRCSSRCPLYGYAQAFDGTVPSVVEGMYNDGRSYDDIVWSSLLTIGEWSNNKLSGEALQAIKDAAAAFAVEHKVLLSDCSFL